MYQKMHATFKKPKVISFPSTNSWQSQKLDDDELAEDKYFDEEGGSHQQAQNDNDDEVDPLDLFMQGLESAGKEAEKGKSNATAAGDNKGKALPKVRIFVCFIEHYSSCVNYRRRREWWLMIH